MKKQDVQAAAKALGGGQEKEDQKVRPMVQVVAFRLDNEEYAVPIADVREVIVASDVVPVPNAPEFIAGLTNVRGTVAVVIDLEKRFGLQREGERPAQPHMLIAESGGSVYGIGVDKMPEVLRVPQDALRPPAQAFSAKLGPDYLAGVIVLEDADPHRMLMLLDLPRLLDQKELLKLGKMVNDDSSSTEL